MNKNTLKIIVLTIIFGLSAGVVGQLLVTAYLLPGEIFVLQENARIKKPLAQTAEKEQENITNAFQAIAKTVLEIYPKKSLSPDANVLSQIYLPKDRLAIGFTITSDGWLVSYGSNLADPQNPLTIITPDQKIFTPQKIFFDPATEVVFLKIDAQNLPVPQFGSIETLSTGEKIIITPNKQSLKITQVENINYEKFDSIKELFQSSEKFSRLILIKDALAHNEIGAPVASINGEIIGIVSSPTSTVMPIDFWQPAFYNILKNDKIKRPYLGINYLNLARTPGLSIALRQEREFGALIWEDKNLKIQGVIKESPAALAGLKNGDIILKLDNDAITRKNNLNELIQKYAPGDKIEITILRNGEEKILEATLGEKL